ncbi:MAG: 50S ribosomal protein L29 [Candidatus Omnitrophota bacterium]|nr:50S ribosomal protein L29 [Candidatus Omnitrophota bacterium]
MKKENFNNLTVDELMHKRASLMQELYGLNYQRKSGRVDKPNLFSKNRKSIARIETQLTKLRKV